MNLDYKALKTWFQNRRMKQKRLLSKSTENIGAKITSDDINSSYSSSVSPAVEHQSNHSLPPTMEQQSNYSLSTNLEQQSNYSLYSSLEKQSHFSPSPSSEQQSNFSLSPSSEQQSNYSLSPSLEQHSNYYQFPSLEQQTDQSVPNLLNADELQPNQFQPIHLPVYNDSMSYPGNIWQPAAEDTHNNLCDFYPNYHCNTFDEMYFNSTNLYLPSYGNDPVYPDRLNSSEWNRIGSLEMNSNGLESNMSTNEVPIDGNLVSELCAFTVPEIEQFSHESVDRKLLDMDNLSNEHDLDENKSSEIDTAKLCLKYNFEIIEEISSGKRFV